MLMGREIICLTVIFLGMVTTASTACSNAFGDNCEYQCHCAGDAACGTEGSCPNRLCASGWEGEYCQRGNVAAGKSSSTSQSSTNDLYYASLALDGDMNQAFSKCSHTNTENQPWWQVDLGREFVLFTVKVVHVIEGDVRECKMTQKGTEYRGTMSTTRNGFTCAHWLDDTIHVHNLKPATNSYNYCRNPDNADGPWCYTTNSNKLWEYCNVQICYSQLKNFKIWMDSNFCHHYKGTVGFGQTVDIRCDTPVVGRDLKIQVMDSWTVLTLCEVTVQAFQYRVCPNKYYGPNCNNRCQCANDVPCYDDKTGRCPSGTCNDRFSGRYCNIGIPQVLKNGPSTPTSISVKWQEYIIHDSAYDSGEFERLSLRYYEPSSTSISIKTGYDNASLPSPSMIKYNVTRLNPSTLYSLYVELTYKHLSGNVAKKGPTANFSTESCASYMATPMITQWESVTEASPWPNRVYLTIRAHVPDMIADCFKELDVYVKKTNESKYMMTSIGADRIFKMKGLTAFTEYDIKATVRSPDDQTKDSFLKIRTAEDVPSAPTIAKAGASPTSVSIRITPPDPPYGVITNYDIEMWKAGSSGNMYSYGPTNLTHTFNELKLNTTYKLKAQAFTSAGGGVWSKVISIITVENIPGPPNTLLAQEHTTNSFVLVWTKPKYPNGILVSYKGICTPLFSYDDEVNTKWMNYAKEFNPGPEVENVKVSHLTPATEYNCSVAAQTSKGFGPSVWLRNWTKPEEAVVPEDLFLSITPGKTTNSTITVEVANMPKSLKTGSISKVRIAVERQETRRKRSTPLLKEDHDKLTNHAAAKEKGYPGYIAAELAANFSGPFVIGDGKTYGGYSNPPLTKGQKYDVIFGMVFAVGEETTIAYRRYGQFITVKGAPSLNVVALAVGLAGGVVVLAVIIIPVVIIMRKKRRAKEETAESLDTHLHDISSPVIIPELDVERELPDNKTDSTEPTYSTEPLVAVNAGKGYSNLQARTIKLTDLATYVKRIRDELAMTFKEEFEELPVDAVKSIKDAKKPENSALNRYKNIVTYDHSRVILQPIGEEISDYINASYIHGYDMEKAYIASQGPLPMTVTAKWRMIWQERCASIIMLTRLEEMGKKKCEQYWPSRGRTTYGPFTVQLVEEYKFTDYVKRILKITLNEEVRTVKHFHFTAWPDHDVPKFACSLLNFRVNVLKEAEYGKTPILLHCSAGVGRSGTFIGIDYLIRQGKAEKKVNFYECVLRMREQRPNMVQNLGQYTHIHDAILEYFKIGITYITSASFPQKYIDMTKPGKQTCPLHKQYLILDAFTDAINPSEVAIKNMGKNRSRDIVPDGLSRVVLSTPIDGWDDYVNAVYATGYGEKDTYIITQMPLPETMKDIWRIVHDTGVSTIVMMNLVDDTYEFSTVYWPQETERMEYGPLVVEGLDMDTSNSDITVRDFRLSKIAGKGNEDGMNGRLVRHFQLQNWPDGQATPSSPESIVELLEMVEKWQQKVKNKKILVHCLDGASQSGVFCVAHSVIEKVKVDHEVDVFQYLRLLRSNRPQLVNTYEQYKFIHEVVLSYLQGFDIYANFQ